jgi:hypothetical protein
MLPLWRIKKSVTAQTMPCWSGQLINKMADASGFIIGVLYSLTAKDRIVPWLDSCSLGLLLRSLYHYLLKTCFPDKIFHHNSLIIQAEGTVFYRTMDNRTMASLRFYKEIVLLSIVLSKFFGCGFVALSSVTVPF